MNHRIRKRAAGTPPCKEVGSDDGIDPRYYFRPTRDVARHHRKTLQLCAQVARTVQLTLGGACRDPLLQALLVVRVEPAPDASSLQISVEVVENTQSMTLVQNRLESMLPRLRAAVAQSVHRKRVPTLSILAVVAGDRA